MKIKYYSTIVNLIIFMIKICIMLIKFWSKYKIVIVSPKVVFGVDFNLEYFDYVYGFYKCTTLTV